MKDKIYPGPSRSHYRMVPLGSYDIPTEVLDIERDVARLELIEHILGQIDGRNCSVEFAVGKTALRWIKTMTKLCRRAAELKLREFLRK